MITLNGYQEQAARTINPRLTDYEKEMHALHLLASEVGDIHGLYQKEYQGHSIKTDDLKKEVGDLLWGIAEYCTSQGWSLEEIATMNIEKLRARYPDGFTEERSINREV